MADLEIEEAPEPERVMRRWLDDDDAVDALMALPDGWAKLDGRWHDIASTEGRAALWDALNPAHVAWLDCTSGRFYAVDSEDVRLDRAVPVYRLASERDET